MEPVKKTRKKLLMVGMNSVHTYSFIRLIEGYFDEVLLITNILNPDYAGRAETVECSIRHPFGLLQTIPSIRKAITTFQPDVIHIHQANTAAWLTLMAAGSYKSKCIVTAWGSDVLRNPQRGFFYRIMVKQILNHAGYLTADARFVAEKMKELADRKTSVTVINFGIDPVCSDEAGLAGCMQQKENIIYSNRLHKKLYRIDQIIKAFAAFVRKHNTHWKLVIAATGEETLNLQQLVDDLGIRNQVSFRGWLPPAENRECYRKAKIYVSIPESDATSVSLLEAMSAGCIPLVSDLPANREWIDDGVNGVVSHKLMEADFEKAAALCREEVVQANLRAMLQQATRSLSRRQFCELYDQIIATA